MTNLICKKCQTENPLGSRFCNNCGQLMPPTTHLICPKCQAQNPRHLMYCDKCGSRLIKEKPAAPKEEKPAAKPSVPPQRAFTLPSRAPGDTGELDLTQLPDWLKTGQTETPKQQPVAPDPDEPPAASLGALDDWLAELDDLDTGEADEPALDWLSGNFDEAEPTAVASAAEEESLPDWLSGNFDEGEPTAVASAAEKESLPDWLGGFDEDEPTAVASVEEDSLPDWLGGGFDEEEPTAVASSAEEESLPDWLSGGFDEQEPTAVASPAEEESLPDWLGGSFDEEEPTAVASSAEEESLPDWLGGSFDEEEPTAVASAAEEESLPDWLDGGFDEAEPTAVASAAEEQFPDWLSDDELADEPAAASFEDSPADDLAWLTASDEETAAGAAAIADDEDDHLTGFTGWLNDALLEPDALAPDAALSGQTEMGLTDWLDAALIEEMVDSDESAADAGLEDETPDWLTAVDDDDAEPDWLSTADEPTADSADDDMPLTGALPDWLVDLAPRGTGILSLPESEDPEAWGGLTEGLDWLRLEETHPDAARPPKPASPSAQPPELIASFPESAEEAPDFSEGDFDWAGLGDSVQEAPPLAENESLDWLSQIDLPAEPQPEPVAASPEPADGDTPDWLSEFASSDEDQSDRVAGWFEGDESESWPELAEVDSDNLTDLIGEDERPQTAQLQGLPPELAAASLPDWLDAASPGGAPQDGDDLGDDFFAPSDDDLPDWLQTSGGLQFDAALDAALPPAAAPPSAGAIGEWDDILGAAPTGSDPFDLGDLPPAGAPDSPILAAAAEIPAWMQALKPRELSGDDAPRPEEPALTSGPLAGLRRVIGIEPVISQPHKAALTPLTEVSLEQQRQAALLRQLTQADLPEAGAAIGDPRLAPPSVGYRLTLTLLLLLAIIVGMLWPTFGLEPDFLRPSPSPLPADLVQVVQNAANRPVLVAFDYTPAWAGELDPQAALLLRQMAANGSQVMFVSQSAAGLAKAEELTAAVPDLNRQSLGYLPGEALGLRYLATCLQQNRVCETVNGRSLEANLASVALIVLITGERDNLVNWVEQVSGQTDAPLLVVMTQALAPTAAPYRATGQLTAVLDNPSLAAAYEQLRPEGDGSLAQNWQATTLARWLAILLFIGGNLWYGSRHFLDQRRRRKGRGA